MQKQGPTRNKGYACSQTPDSLVDARRRLDSSIPGTRVHSRTWCTFPDWSTHNPSRRTHASPHLQRITCEASCTIHAYCTTIPTSTPHIRGLSPRQLTCSTPTADFIGQCLDASLVSASAAFARKVVAAPRRITAKNVSSPIHTYPGSSPHAIQSYWLQPARASPNRERRRLVKRSYVSPSISLYFLFHASENYSSDLDLSRPFINDHRI